jgi:hypothetical protein
MAYYAELDENNVVTAVRTGTNEFSARLEEIYQERFGKVHKRTSYNTRGGIHYDSTTNQASEDQSKSLRKNYAGVGYSYDQQRDAFIPPQPFPSWTLNETSCLWEAPVAMPSDGKAYMWDEDSAAWEEVTAA